MNLKKHIKPFLNNEIFLKHGGLFNIFNKRILAKPFAGLISLIFFFLISFNMSGCSFKNGVFSVFIAYPNSDSNVDQVVLDVENTPLLTAEDIKEIHLDGGTLLFILNDTGVQKLSSIKSPYDTYLVFRNKQKNLASAKYLDQQDKSPQQRIQNLIYAEDDRLYLFSYDKKSKNALSYEKKEIDALRSAALRTKIVWKDILSSEQKLAVYPASAPDFNGPVSEAVITGPSALNDMDVESLSYDKGTLTVTILQKENAFAERWQDFFSYDTCIILINGKPLHIASLSTGGINIAKGYSIVREKNAYKITYICETPNEDNAAETNAAKEEIGLAMETLAGQLRSAGLDTGD